MCGVGGGDDSTTCSKQISIFPRHHFNPYAIFIIIPYIISAMATLSRAEAEAQVSSWGFNHVFTWTDRP